MAQGIDWTWDTYPEYLDTLDRLPKVSLRIVTMPIQSQGIITRDNVSVDVSAVAYFRVTDAVKSVVAIENVTAAIDQRRRVFRDLRDAESLLKEFRELFAGQDAETHFSSSVAAAATSAAGSDVSTGAPPFERRTCTRFMSDA